MSDSKVVVIGAGPAGLVVALSLARRGRPTTLLERDPAPPLEDPRAAYSSWSRPSVPQSRQPHSLLGRTRRALRMNAPDVLAGLIQAGAWENDLRERLVREATQPGDEDLVAVHCRRPVFESVLRKAALDEPLVKIASATPAAGIQVERVGSGPPRVTGVHVGGATIDADVVVDAGGRRSPVRRWVENAGFTMPPGDVQECGVVYYSRYFRLRDGVDYPPWKGVLGPGGTTDCTRFSTFFGDNGTFAIVLGIPAWDHAFRVLAQTEIYMRAVTRFPSLAPFIAENVAVPLTDVMPMGALQNVFHPPLQEGGPPVLGLHFVGDSYCHTNPLFAWGLCLGVDYGFALGRIIDDHAADPEAQALAYAALTEVEAEQCYQAVAEEDRDRSLTWQGAQPSGPWLGRTFAAFVRQCAAPAVLADAQVAGAVLRRANLLELPQALTEQDQVLQRVIELQPELPQPPPGAFPTRDELVELISRS